VIAEFAVHVERQLRVGGRFQVVRRILALQQLDRAVRVIRRQRDVGHADVEPILASELHIAQVQLAVAGLVEHGDFHRMDP
jgi:hypothetical protein